ncbi:hypothetical protein KZZ52_34590 [Dactylosporangium sp. AC04546]|uniref:hypothetical protein n=1 Tax=Dactylosporangium sp. AC04546 TaxID=2862460 RepID=UPI001EDEA75A|nr:hypothetical protein [Dactylosporangium sp. AC04546]WVK79101.1 hypothetical protein KZZ52_34590 [Dactylosporangium sp. AC04546]
MHQLFDELIGTPPETSIDTRALVRRDRRQRATRHAALTLSAVAVAAAGITVGVFTSATTPAGAPPAAQASPTQDDRFELRSATRAEAEVSAGELAAALDDAVRAAVPAATWEPGPGIRVTVIDYVSPPGWHGSGTLRVSGATGALTVMAHTWTAPGLSCATLPTPQVPKGREPTKPATPRQCADVRTPAGVPAVLLTGGPGPTQGFELRVALPADRVMTLIVTGSDDGGPTVLTTDQALLVAEHAAGRIR